MQPPVGRIVLPEEVRDLITEMQMKERTGCIEIHFLRGEIMTAKMIDSRQIAKPKN